MTILFHDDWEKFPNAIPDWSTTNIEFKRYAAILKSMGVKNYRWPVTLLNPELQGVDPFSTELTREQMFAIKHEAEYNIWYYLRECIRIPPSSGEVGDFLRANRANMSFIWSYMNHIDYLLIQPRQTGKSLISYCLYSWLLYIKYTNARISLVTKSDGLRTETATMVRRIREYLPPYLTVADKTDSMTTDRVTYNVRKNVFNIAVSRADEAGANKVGRGNTSPTVGWDEVPFITHIAVAFKAAMPGMDNAIKTAKKNNLPYGSIMTTTAGDQTTRDGKYVYNMWLNAARWSECFLDVKGPEELRKTVESNLGGKNSKVLINGTWSHSQVGVSDEDHYENMRRSDSKGPEADRDYFNIWTAGGLDNPIDKDLLAKGIKSQRYSDYSEIFAGGIVVHWYVPRDYLEEKRKTLKIIIGADTSEGGGGDAMSLVLVDPYDLSVVGTATINEVLIPRYAEFLADIMVSYPGSVLIPERKSTGQTFIDYLCIILHQKGFDPFKRIWNKIVDDRSVDPGAFAEIVSNPQGRDDAFYTRRKKLFGFSTGTTTRRTLYEIVLKIGMQKGATRLHDKTLIAQITGLVSKNGRIDHGNSVDDHDDSVIAWLLTIYMLVYGNNLDFYGIDARKVMSRAVDIDTIANDDTYDEVDDLSDQVEALLEELAVADNPMTKLKIERKLKFLANELKLLGSEPVNLSSKIEEINASRRDEFEKYNSGRYYR